MRLCILIASKTFDVKVLFESCPLIASSNDYDIDLVILDLTNYKMEKTLSMRCTFDGLERVDLL